jgi:hypothetical protein
MPHARSNPVADPRDPSRGPDDAVSELFHRLNNHLGIILANAELLEAKAVDETTRARAAQVETSVLDALSAARDLRGRFES